MKQITRSTAASHLPSEVHCENETPVVVSCGVGVDSVALLIGLKQRHVRPDLIIFADTGGEKPQTYLYVPLLRQWLRDASFPELVVVRKTPPIARYDSLYGNCIANETMPSIAFRFQRKTCSLKWKVEPMEDWRRHWPPGVETWAADRKVIKYIGFEACEGYRTFAGTNNQHDMARYVTSYPLMEWGWDREKCKGVIADAGLPVPVKSACFFCPAMKAEEVVGLRDNEPVLYQLAIDMETGFRGGKHYRGPGAVQGLASDRTWIEIVYNADAAYTWLSTTPGEP